MGEYEVAIDYANGESYPMWTLLMDNQILHHWHKKPTIKQIVNKVKKIHLTKHSL